MPLIEQEPAPYTFNPGGGELHGEGSPPGGIANPGPLRGAVTAAMLLGLGYAADHWAAPILKVTARQRRSGLAGWLDWLAAQLVRYVTPGVNFVRHELSKAASHRAHDGAGLLHLLAWRWTQTQIMLAHLGEAVASGFERGFYHTVPVKIRKQTAPLKREARRLRVGQIRLGRNVHAIGVRLDRDLPRRGRVRLRHLERRVYGHDEPLLGRIATRLDHDEPILHHDHALLRRMRWAAGFAGAVPLVLYAFKRLRLQSLLCRNTRQFTEEVCASPSGYGKLGGRLLRELVTDLMTFLGLISVVVFAHEVYDFTAFAARYIRLGIEELRGLSGEDYIGAVGVPLDLLARDYLD